MQKRSSKPRDLNKLAKAIVDQSSSDEPEKDPYEGKDPAAVELGRRGGLKGGKARAANLSKERRTAIARAAAEARWAKSRRGSKRI